MIKFKPFGLVAQAWRHWRFYRRARVLRIREAAEVLTLGTLTIIAESAGVAMLLPILSFVERGRDVASFAASSNLARLLVDFYTSLGITISLVTLSIAALLFIVLRQAISFFNSVEIERIKWSIGRRLSLRVFEAVLASNSENIRAYKPGEFAVTAEYECQATASIARVYGSMWMHSIAFMAYGIVLIWTAPLASLLAALMIVLSMLGLHSLQRATKRLSAQAVNIRRTYADFLNERFRAWRLIKLSNTLTGEVRKAEKIQASVVANQVHMLRVSGAIGLIFVPLMTAFLLGVLYVFVEVLALNVATIVLFVLVMVRLMPISQAFQRQLNMLASYSPSFEKIDDVLTKAKKSAEIIDQGKNIVAVEDCIQFDHVTLTYPDRGTPALRDVCATIPAGKMTALIGPSGAGKSTFVDMIPRIIEPQSGRILVDGVPIREISLRSLRRMIAFVPQDAYLFDTTFAENIRYARPDATDEEVREAAQLANASEFIESMPLGYATPLGDAGSKLSGGQKQRVVLARAFLSQARILILDEPTSALDYESEAAVQRAIERIRRQRDLTIVVIAHRLSTVRNADLVLQMAEGRIIQAGPAAEILHQTGATTDALAWNNIDVMAS